MTLTPATIIVPSLLVSGVVAYGLFDLVKNYKVFGGTKPGDMPSLHGEWSEATRRRLMSNEREGNPDIPVLLNPFRHNIPATVRNAGDMPSLD